MVNKRYDAIVVGLGPAGSTACHTLASRGLTVAGIDKERHPRHKSCGGCLSTKINGLFDFDISRLVEATVYGITFTYKYHRRLDIRSEQPIGHNVRRETFDLFLVEKARSAGADIIEGERVVDVADDGGCVSVTTADGTVLKAGFLIGADGASGLIGRKICKLDPRRAAVSITAEVPFTNAASGEPTDMEHVDFASIPHGYSWIFPKKDRLSIGLAIDSVKAGAEVKRYFSELVSRHPLLQGVAPQNIRGWTIPLHYNGATQAIKGRIILAGDTGHLVEPFMGEGIYYACLTGKAAARAVADTITLGKDGLAHYQAWLASEIYPEFIAARKLSEITYKYPQLWYSVLEKDPDVMRRFYEVIRGETGFRQFYAWVLNRVKTRPIKMFRMWVGARFLPK